MALTFRETDTIEEPRCTDGQYRGERLQTQAELDSRFAGAQSLVVAKLGEREYQVCSPSTCVVVTLELTDTSPFLCKHVLAAWQRYIEEETGKKVMRFCVPGVEEGVPAFEVGTRFRAKLGGEV